MTEINKFVALECYEFIMMHSAAACNDELREFIGMTDEQANQISNCAIDESLAKIITTHLPNTSDALAFIDEMKSHSAPWVNELLESAKVQIS